jgi:hypothetical protein
MRGRYLAWAAAAGVAACAPPGGARESRPFVLRAVDEATGRGVPLVEFRTTNAIAAVTDNAGVVAFDEPGLLGERVFFFVESPGYEAPADGFGMRGLAADTRPGGEATVRLRRLQAAERLYRITGQGLYHHSERAGLPVPLRRPSLNARVMGQDTAMAVEHRGRLRWFWGDTSRPGHPLGHFGTATASSGLPGRGGLDPSVGVELEYAVDATGFSRPAFDLGEPGAVWVHGAFVIRDPEGRERIVAQYERVKDLGRRLELGIAAFDDERERFAPLVRLALDEERHPFGQAFRSGGYVYFATPYPFLRVPDRWEDVLDPSRYEAFTCLKGAYDRSRPEVVRDAAGKAAYAWRAGAVPVGPERQEEMIRGGHLRPEEAWIGTADAASGERLHLHRGSVRWNAHRRRWVMVANRAGAKDSFLGDVYYAEADAPEGPWPKAVRVASHGAHSFYNPVHHAFFDREGGRLIHFEGTYTRTFSSAPAATPRYEYNQLLYRLDLDDPRLGPAR